MDNKKKISININYFLVSLYAGLISVLYPYYSKGSDGYFHLWHFPVVLLVTYFAICFFHQCIVLYRNRFGKKDILEWSDLKTFLTAFFTVFFAGFIWLLIFYPGVSDVDTIAIMINGYGVASQYPWFYCFAVQGLQKIVYGITGNMEIFIFVFSFLQLIFCSTCFSFVLVWLKRKRINRMLWFIFLVTFAFCPIVDNFLIALIKDTLFGVIMFLWVPVLYEIAESRGGILKNKYFCFLMGVLFLLTSYLRNNGIYISIVLLTILLLRYRSCYKRILVFAAEIVLLMIITVVVEHAIHVEHLFKETVGIPLQQISAVVVNDGNISEEEGKFIDSIVDREYIKENFDPYSVDPIKWSREFDNEFINSNKAEFLKCWFSIIVKNPKIAVEEYLRNTNGFWGIGRSVFGYKGLGAAFYNDWVIDNNINSKNILPPVIQEKTEGFIKTLLPDLISGGFYFLILLGMISEMITLKDKGPDALIAVPSLLLWLTVMVATPIADSWRYILGIFLSLFPIFWSFFILKEKR